MAEVEPVSRASVVELVVDLGPPWSVGSGPCGRSRKFPSDSRPSVTRWMVEHKGKASHREYRLPGICSWTAGEVWLGEEVVWPSLVVSWAVEVGRASSQASLDGVAVGETW